MGAGHPSSTEVRGSRNHSERKIIRDKEAEIESNENVESGGFN